MSQGIIIIGLQNTNISIGVSVGLKISQVFLPLVFVLEEINTFLDLGKDRFTWLTIIRIEAVIVALGTTTMALAAIAIRASKTRIQGDLLHTGTKGLSDIV